MPTGSPYRDLVSITILKLQEAQTLQLFYNKWWKQRGGAGRCDVDDGKKDANALSFNNVGGVFVVLTAGLLLSLVVVVIEFVWTAHKRVAGGHQKRVSSGGSMTVSACVVSKPIDNKPSHRVLPPGLWRLKLKIRRLFHANMCASSMLEYSHIKTGKRSELIIIIIYHVRTTANFAAMCAIVTGMIAQYTFQ